MRKITKIIIHSSATPEGREVTPEEICKWHRAAGKKQIGYHFVVPLDGKVKKGRDIKEIGAHAKNHNLDGIGICYVGGCDKAMKPKDTRTLEQKEGLLTLLTELKKMFPNAEIGGHCDYNKTACPSFDAKTEYSNI